MKCVSISLLHKIISRMRWELAMRHRILSDGPVRKLDSFFIEAFVV